MYAFASPYRNQSRPSAGLYSQVGVETGVTSADPHKLIAMLFDGLLDAISQARGAIQDNRIEAKGVAISRAVRIVDEGLRGGLNMNSGALSEDLSALYRYLVLRLTQANVRNDDAALEECTRLIQPLRDAWIEIRSKVAAGPSK